MNKGTGTGQLIYLHPENPLPPAKVVRGQGEVIGLVAELLFELPTEEIEKLLADLRSRLGAPGRPAPEKYEDRGPRFGVSSLKEFKHLRSLRAQRG